MSIPQEPHPAGQRAPGKEPPLPFAVRGWLPPLLRVVFLLGAGTLVWFVAGEWNSWTGAARFQRTDDA